jgi:hypothetical protein
MPMRPPLIRVDFQIGSRAVRLRAVCAIEADDYVDVGVSKWIARASSDFARRYSLRLIDGECQWSGGVAWAVLRFAVPGAIRLDEVLAFHDDLRLLIEHSPAHADEQRLWALIRAGLPQGLIGCPESHWLDAKREPYVLSGPLGRLELAKDVSAFANSGGGLLVLGLATTTVDGVDVVSRVRPIPRARLSAQSYRSVLRTAIYPRLQGLEIVVVSLEDDAAVVGIRIPRQPVTNLPFIVRGMPGMRDRKIEGAYWGIFRRQGDESVPIDAAQVHTAVRGGVL